MENQVPLLKIKSFLSGKDPIKRTPKGVKYRVFNVKRKRKDETGKMTFNGHGTVLFFSDFGERANISKLKYGYDNSSKKFYRSGDSSVTWIHIKNGRLVLSKFENDQYRNISNSPYKIDFSMAGGNHRIKKQNETKEYITYKHETRFKKILAQWARRNKISVSKKQMSMNLEKFLLTLCYPELIYFFDVMDEKIYIKKIPSIISSELRGIKGMNHAFDRLIGTHGKKIKNKILEDSSKVFERLSVARLFKNLVEVDDLLKILDIKDIERLIPYRSLYISIRYFLRNYSRDTIVNWMLKEKVSQQLLIDVARQYHENNKNTNLPPILLPNTNSFADIENHVNRDYRRNRDAAYRSGGKNQDIDYTEINKKYSDFEFNIDSFSCCLPKNSKEMRDVSNELSNCLSSYINIHGKSQMILFVKHLDAVKYAISIGSDKRLLQFYGKYNKIPEKVEYNTICEILRNKYINTFEFDAFVNRKTERINAVDVN